MNEKIINNISKEKFFEEISEMFYKRNFGTKTKSDFELLMFKFYFDSAKDLAKSGGIIDENSISDYKIGRELGITPSRVKNLRLKMELQFGEDFNWKSEILKVMANAQNITLDGDYIAINIRSRNLYNAVRDGLEDSGALVELTLNNNVLKVGKDKFIKLLLDVTEDIELTELKKEIEKELKNRKISEKVEEVEKWLNIACSGTEMLANLVKTFNLGSQVSGVINNVYNLIKKGE